MQTLVIYDIVSDKIRRKVMEACKDYGLLHVQYSAFFGDLNHNRREELIGRLRRTLGDSAGKIFVCPVCDKDWRLKMEIEVFGGTGAPVTGEVTSIEEARPRKKKAKAG